MKRPRVTHWTQRAATVRVLGALLGAAFLGACATTPGIVERYDDAGVVVLEKRYAKHMAVDYVHRASRIAYRPLEDGALQSALSADQEAILVDLGRPQLARMPFRSRLNELVTEWVYLERQHVAQFIEGRLVYEGDLTDYERTLVENGYPDIVSELRISDGGQFVHWTYIEPFESKGREYAFDNDSLIYHQESQ